MNRLTALALLGSLTITGGSVHAATCPVPEAFTVDEGGLAATKAAVAQRNLVVLALGGSSTLGIPAGGAAFTYPARLEARLREALPLVTIKVVVQATARMPEDALLAELDAGLAKVKPILVIWGPGASAAARGDDLDTFMGTLNEVIGKVQSAGADLILMTLQYAPSVSRLENLSPYRMAVIRSGNDTGVPVLDRYELMRFWSDSGFLDLDATNADDRVRVSRALYDCMAEILGNAIVDATK
jgi:acyl-CoA thioesterase-1